MGWFKSEMSHGVYWAFLASLAIGNKEVLSCIVIKQEAFSPYVMILWVTYATLSW